MASITPPVPTSVGSGQTNVIYKLETDWSTTSIFRKSAADRTTRNRLNSLKQTFDAEVHRITCPSTRFIGPVASQLVLKSFLQPNQALLAASFGTVYQVKGVMVIALNCTCI